MLRRILPLGMGGFVLFLFFKFTKKFFGIDSRLNYSIEEQDIVADLPGAQMHINMPAG